MTPPERVAVIGLGKVGLPLVMALGSRGIRVTGYDRDPTRCHLLREATAAARFARYEAGLAEAMILAAPYIDAAGTTADAIADAALSFVIVPTPSTQAGGFSFQYVESAMREVGAALRDKTDAHVVVLVSTVMPGTIRDRVRPVLEAASGRTCGDGLGLCYAPVLIALGDVVSGILSPDFAFVGEVDRPGADRLERFYEQVLAPDTPLHRMSAESVEIAKLALNNFLTMKISFSNLIGELCARTAGADAGDVLGALGQDSRVGERFLAAGMGFGGPCLPRDNAALACSLAEAGLSTDLFASVSKINHDLPTQLTERIGLVAGKRVAVVGLGYKPDTVHTEDSFAVRLCNVLFQAGAEVHALDAQATEMDLSALAPGIAVSNNAEATLPNCALAVLTGHGFAPEGAAQVLSGMSVFDVNVGGWVFRPEDEAEQ